MSNPDDASRTDPNNGYIDGVDSGELAEADGNTLSLTPAQHERLKNRLHGERFADIRRADQRYLVIGRGGDDGPGKRRRTVCALLDERRSATAFRLEDFGFTGEEVELWAPAFDILSGMATHVVGVLEDYDGGHVWELGYLYHHQSHIRDVLWLLKRVYETEAKRREQYDNGMAASHLAALEEAAGDHVISWTVPEDLPDAVKEIPATPE
ncbi:aminopeptidase [Halostagnicola sp. A-GB9-2]|uniref:aminopeptidase n=1 Tax=Halostagnicola sp. A-GB9-2 TaxID=3048066 RepID=UPI0024BF4A7D|nr:aminopeptidase [Halostagnicola sp. A-GB9-2]MDJ1430944.1 aminopeptidase [Halostagnicola sp. A-GB9-2]